jgi:hypothetical protein
MSDDEVTPERFRLVLLCRALPDRRRAEIRLRLLLKDLLRGYGLTCERVEALDAADDDHTEGGAT